VTDLDGDPITYNREDVWLHDGILASNGCAHDQLVGLVPPYSIISQKPVHEGGDPAVDAGFSTVAE